MLAKNRQPLGQCGIVYLGMTLSRERESNAYNGASLIKKLDISISILLFRNFL